MVEQHKQLKLVITGSSSQLLSSEIATELRGRAVSHKIYPLSFKEFCKVKYNIEINLKTILYSERKAEVKRMFNDYFSRGGFPALIKRENYEPVLQEYYKTIFYRDIIERYALKHIKLFEDFIKLQVNEFAALSSITAMHKKLTTLGYRLSKNTINNYFFYARETFLFFPVERLDAKIKNRLLYPKKVYVIDHGMVQAVRFSFSEDYEKILENIICLELIRRDKNIFYYQNKFECDFVVAQRNEIQTAIQVTKTLSDPKTKSREINGLVSALTDLGLKNGIILTEDEYEELSVEDKNIKIWPVWYWLLV
jgi:hypothetical protein